MRTPVAVALCVILLEITGCRAQYPPSLEILPSQKHQKIAVHKSAVLTCQPNVANIDQVSNLQWKDHRGLVINPASHGPRPEMYTETMPGKQSLLLYITSITPAMAGNYTCVASYAVNEQLSNSVWIDTYVAITWVNAPEFQHATKGKEFKVMCEVTAEPAPSVDWFKDGLLLKNNERYVIHRNCLQINNVTESDDGTYMCRAVVIETGELAERNIKLEVFIAPEMEPEVQTEIKIKKGESAEVRCRATGKPLPTFTWIKDSTKQNLNMPGSRFSVSENDGLLRINQVEAGDYGTYTCLASNRAGQNEIQFNIQVVVPPVVERIENVTFSAQKEEARLVCRATGRPAPEIVFRKLSNEKPFVFGTQPEDDRIVIDSSVQPDGDQFKTTGVITIARLNRTDDGLYECIAKNEGGEGRLNGHIQVKFAPSFASMPTEPVWSWGGRPANLSCLAESIPNATIKWRYQARELIESNHVKIFGSAAFSFVTITPTDDSLFGVYKCIATNSEGEAEHSIQFLKAFPPGPIVQAKQEAITATSVRFSIEPPAQMNGPRVLAVIAQYKESGNFDWTYSKNRTWSISSPYTVEGLSSMTTYDFRFAAINQVGTGSWGAPLTVTMLRRSAPEQPKWRDVVSANSLMHAMFADRYELKWKIPADNGEPIDGYKVRYCPVRKVNGEWQEISQLECRTEDVESHRISYEMRQLRPDTHYKVELRARNQLGYSAPGVLYVQTAIGAHSPGFIRPSVLSSSTIVGVVVGGILVLLLLLDLILYCTIKQGLMATLCGKRAKKHDDDEAKLGRDEKDPLKENHPMLNDVKQNSSVEFDGHRVYSTAGSAITGKNSAV